MKQKNALTVVQTRCKSSANTGANLPSRGATPTGALEPYTPYEELQPSPTAPQPSELAPAALTAAAQVLVLLLKCVTLGAVNISGSIDQHLHLQAKRRRWRQISAEAVQDWTNNGQVQSQTSRQCRTDIVRPDVQRNRQGHVTIVHNYFINQDK